MKRIFFILTTTVSLAILGTSCRGQQAETATGNISCTPAEKEAITRTLEFYLEGNRQADSKILEKAFAETATLSTNRDGKLFTIPIQDFYTIVDGIEPVPASYTLTACSVEQDIAMVRIELEFGTTKYTDMFTLVKGEDEWKIVSKVTHRH